MRKRFVDIMRSMRSEKCMIALLVIMGILVSGSSVGLAQTNDKCKIPEEYKKKWSEPEEWAWGEICAGRWADFNKRPGYEKLDPRNPEDDDKWKNGRRTLSSRFLKDILLDEPFRSVIPHSGVRIYGAYFKDRINLFDKSIQRPLSIKSSLFKSRMNMDRFKTPEFIAFAGSRFDGTLDMKSAIIGGGLFIEGTHFNKVVLLDEITIGGNLIMGGEAKFNKKVVLKKAKVDGRISMQTSTFNHKLDMRSVSIGRDLGMADATFDRVDLSRAKITGNLNMEDSDFKGRLNMESASVGGDLHMRDKAEFYRDVVLRGAKIRGDLDMSVSMYRNSKGDTPNGNLVMEDSKFKGRLDMDYTEIGGDLLMRNVKFDEPVNLAFLKVGSNLDVRGATLRELDLTGARIKDEFRLGPSGAKNIEWKGRAARLTLRDTSVGVLQDTQNAWPDDLELDGFTYKNFVSVEKETPYERGIEWFVDWLRKDKTYKLQPYHHLARIIRADGFNDMADDVLFVSRTHERAANLGQFKWLQLTLLQIFYGYGYGRHSFWALFRIAMILIAIGTLIIYVYITERRKRGLIISGFRDSFWYSIDMLLPGMRLREKHYKMDLKTKPVRYYFHFHKILGYLLIFFVVAWLTNLTK